MFKLKVNLAKINLPLIRHGVVLLVFISLNIECFASNYSSWNQSIKSTSLICNEVSGLTIPKEDIPPKTFTVDCSFTNFYHAVTTEQEYKKAKFCAVSSHDKKNLIRMYANGKGGARNIDLAIHLACDFNIITATHIRRIEHLLTLKANQSNLNEFDIEDDEDKIERLELDIGSYIDKLDFHMPLLVEEVKTQSEIFLKHRVFHETHYQELPLSSYQEDFKARRAWFNLFKTIVECSLPEYNKLQFVKADAELNNVFKFLKKSKLENQNQETAIPFESILETERAWLKYKNAMIRFERARCPSNNPYSLATYLTLERTDQLKKLHNR